LLSQLVKHVSNSSTFTPNFSANGFNSSILNHSHPHSVAENIESIYSRYFSPQAIFSTHLLACASIFAFLCTGRGKFLKIKLTLSL